MSRNFGCRVDLLFKRRKTPVIERLLKELFRALGPELRNIRIGLDYGVLQLATDLLDFPDVHILNRVAIAVNLQRPPGNVR